MTERMALRPQAEGFAAALPPLMAAAERLAASVLTGGHGRARAGRGEEFWQFRAATAGDAMRQIDWRRSARSDQSFVRETEWQSAQSVLLWVDPSQAMSFAGAGAHPPKSHVARVLALALAILLLRGGERVGLLDPALPAGAGLVQRERLFQALEGLSSEADYGSPPAGPLPARGRAVLISDFFADPAPLQAFLARAADQGVRGALVQLLDPAEHGFPFAGRTRFESMSGALRHDTLQAGDLRGAYLARLEERQALLSGMAAAAGWQFHSHSTGAPAASVLLWLYRALEQRAG
ncbi:DUF58 domain-containing protein [Falsigemmobacter faecalis]|uniref:DUF58 domain-containing protein n=1 Tax=Falsigemmobacter faecalis TaxID=2488730 RepID=A0A3P3DRJ2_9RHOB|nr:DUF58 domain-containing protein [Falsigemmobacter faecalis]RRH76839.1 DUF58 domain-containing protein [Falsigemmobacter faecalis]